MLSSPGIDKGRCLGAVATKLEQVYNQERARAWIADFIGTTSDWLQGIIMMRFGSTRRGEAVLRTARRGFIEMEAAFELALVSLDLGRYLYRSGKLDELKALAVETQQLFSTLCADPQANQALAVWKDAVPARTVSTEAFAATWENVQQRAIETSPV